MTNPVPSTEALFASGVFTITPAALDVLAAHAVSGSELLERFLTGDWPELDPRERLANLDALTRSNAVVVSRYTLDQLGQDQVTLISEPDRLTILATGKQAKRLLGQHIPRTLISLAAPTEDEPGLWRIVR